MNTERMKELLHNFKTEGICKDSSKKKPFEKMLEWQDHIGRSNVGEIVAFWESLPPLSGTGVDQDTFLWVNQSTLNPDMVNSIYRDTVGAKIRKDVYDEASARFDVEQNRLNAKEREIDGFLAKMNEWEATKLKLQEEIQRLTDQLKDEQVANQDLVSRYETQIQILTDNLLNAEQQAGKWQKFQSLIGELVKQ